ncbi:hypothetical protein BC830DRAFT_1172503 [Chytriomyces sp. MP71]|nr:hypothetical protein BC830DRAFT_1172503 [Chytriomyces sp. MP71]
MSLNSSSEGLFNLSTSNPTSVTYDMLLTVSVDSYDNASWVNAARILVQSWDWNSVKPGMVFVVMAGQPIPQVESQFLTHLQNTCNGECAYFEKTDRVRVLAASQSNLGKVYNRAVSLSKSTHLVFVRDTISPTQGYIDELLKYCRNQSVAVVTSRNIYSDGTTRYAGYTLKRASTFTGIRYLLYSRYRGATHGYAPADEISRIDLFNDVSTIVRKISLKRVGGFPSRVNERPYLDLGMKLCYNQVYTKGNLCMYAPASVVLFEGLYDGHTPNNEIDPMIYGSDLESFNERWAKSLPLSPSSVVWYHSYCNIPAFLQHLEDTSSFQLNIHTRGHDLCSRNKQLSGIPMLAQELLKRNRYYNMRSPQDGSVTTITIHDRAYTSMGEAFTERKPNENQILVGRYHFDQTRHGKNHRRFIEHCQQDLDEVWVYTEYEQQRFIESGMCETKLRVVPDSVDVDLFSPFMDEAILNLDAFRILEECDGLRINDVEMVLYSGIFDDFDVWHAVVNAFVTTYRPVDKIWLVLQFKELSGERDGGKYVDFVTKFLHTEFAGRLEERTIPIIAIIDRDLTPEEHRTLYRSSQAVIMPSLASTLPYFFNIPEIMAMQVPIIDTLNTVTMGYLNTENAFLISEDLVHAFPYSPSHLSQLPTYLQQCMTDQNNSQEKAILSRNYVAKSHNANLIATKFKDTVTEAILAFDSRERNDAGSKYVSSTAALK